MAQNTTLGIIKTLAKRPTSVNTSYINVPARNVRGLYRRELSPGIIARFAAKFSQVDGCWLWHAGKFAKGYGMFNIGRYVNGKQHTEYAHRVAFVLSHGDIPPGLVVMHSCDTPACVNPSHLSLGTQTDNVADAYKKGHYARPRAVGSVRWQRERRRRVAA